MRKNLRGVFFNSLRLMLVIFLTASAFSVALPLVHTTYSDFSSGISSNIDVITPDPDGTDDGALKLSEYETIFVLQVYPDGFCESCIYNLVYEYERDGTPDLNFQFCTMTMSSFNAITSVDGIIRVRDSRTGVERNVTLGSFHILYFGVGNGFGGRGINNDLNTTSKGVVEAFARRGKGLVLTHDTLAKRRNIDSTFPFCCIDTRNFEHANFNDLTSVSGLAAEWVGCCIESTMYSHVVLEPSSDAGAIVLNVPFNLPSEFDVTLCHPFGEVNTLGDVWYQSSDGHVYMQTYHEPTYNSYSAYFSSGHTSLSGETTFRPLEWEAKAMINSMYYAYNGGEGVGVYTSEAISLPSVGGLDSIVWVETLPEFATLRVQVSISTDGISYGDWYEVTNRAPITGVSFRSLKYRVLMNKGRDLPVLHRITIWANVPAPLATLIYPLYWSSCSCAKIAWLISSDYPVSLSTARAEIGGRSFGSSAFTLRGDTLIFEPPGICFENGDSVRGSLTYLENSLGFWLPNPVPFNYVVDIEPPVFTMPSPLPSSVISDPSFDISLFINDLISGVTYGSIFVTVDGDTIRRGLLWDSPTGRLTVNAETAGIHRGEDVRICVGASDRATVCGANDSVFCWDIYVDTLGPLITMLEPLGYTSCDSLYASFLIDDRSGVDPSSFVIIVNGTTYRWSSFMTWDGSVLGFRPPIHIGAGDCLIINIYSASDSLGNTTSTSLFSVVRDGMPPSVTGLFPLPGITIGDSLTMIYIDLTDDRLGNDPSSVYFTIGDTLTVPAVFSGARFSIEARWSDIF
jgi:hypothetical protein